MNEKFEQLDPEKKERILNAAYDEFAEKGYENASTNVIAKNAGIGKGTLFNYFGSKENLFHELIRTAFDTVKKEYLDKVDYDETDFFKRVRETSKLKWKVYIEYRSALSFMASTFLRSNEFVLPKELQERRDYANQFWADILTKNIDFSKFREDMPVEKSFNLVRWTMDGYRTELEARFSHDEDLLALNKLTDDVLEPYYDEFYDLLDTLKRIYYKPEYHEE